MAPDRTMKSSSRRILAVAAVTPDLAGMDVLIVAPISVEASLVARQLIPDYCEYQAASLIEAP